MDALSAFGLFAVTAMLVCYAAEQRSPWFILAFAGSCALGSAYGFLQGAWPFGLVETTWVLVALRRWHHAIPSRLPTSALMQYLRQCRARGLSFDDWRLAGRMGRSYGCPVDRRYLF
jgi:hypothetical protein